LTGVLERIVDSLKATLLATLHVKRTMKFV